MGNRNAKSTDATSPLDLDPSTGLVEDDVPHSLEEDLAFLSKRFNAADVARLKRRLDPSLELPDVITTPKQLREALDFIEFFDTEWFSHVCRHGSLLGKGKEQVARTREILLGSNEYMDLLTAALFKELDQNGDGKISHRELLFAVLAYGNSESDIDVLRLRYNNADADGSRVLSPDEILQWMMDSKRDELKMLKVTISAAFDFVHNDLGHDADVKNVTDRAETIIKNFLDACDAKLQANKDGIVKRYLKLNDKNHDGQITFDEFVSGSRPKQLAKLRKYNESILSKETSKMNSQIRKLMWDLMMGRL